MKLKVYENRQLEIIQEIGTQNENNVELIELEVPEKYIDWNKKIVFVLDNEIYWDFVQDETYLINKAITKNKEVGIYIWLTNEDKDFRTITRTMHFNNNVDASEQITLEEEAEANRFIAYIEGEKQELEDLIDEVQTKLDNGEFNGKDGKDGQDGIDGQDGQPGKDGQDGSNGYSPTIRTIETIDGYDIEITDINGTRTITILNGKDGKNGLNGQDGKDGQDGAKGEKGDPGNPGATGNGIASIVKTNTSGLIDTYTITFTNGTSTTFQVTNGQNGQPGANGQDGRDGTNGVDGQDGQDGYTPVRGTDYWTSSDIAAIEDYCDNYIDTNITQVLGGSY